MAEQDMMSDEAARVAMGADPRDLSAYEGWRETTDDCIQQALGFYAEYLVGQTSGMTDALSLPAVRAAFEIDGVPQEARPEMTHRLLMIHADVAEIVRAKEKAKSRHG